MIPPRVSLFTVLIGVRLRGLFSMVRSIQMMSVRYVRMIPALFMRSFFVMPSRLLVVAALRAHDVQRLSCDVPRLHAWAFRFSLGLYC